MRQSKMLVFALLLSCTFTISARHENSYHQPREKSQGWVPLTQNVTGALCLGSVIGAFYGSVCACLERSAPDYLLFNAPISLIVFILMKHATLEHVLSEAKRQRASCDRTLLYNSAWISDWIAYLYCHSRRISI